PPRPYVLALASKKMSPGPTSRVSRGPVERRRIRQKTKTLSRTVLLRKLARLLVPHLALRVHVLLVANKQEGGARIRQVARVREPVGKVRVGVSPWHNT